MNSLLTFVGSHIVTVIIACAELVVAGLLFAWGMSFSGRKKTQKGRGKETLFDSCMKKQDQVAYLLIQKKAMLPVYVTGNPEKLIDVSFDDLCVDIRRIFSYVKNPKDSGALWDELTGEAGFDRTVEMKDGRWLRFCGYSELADNTEILEIREYTEDHGVLENYRSRFAELEKESNSKTTFLYRMSHEIRTPMNGIIGMVDLAEGKLPADSEAMQYLRRCDELSQHLLSLINDILDMSRIEAGKVEIEKNEFSIHALGNRLYDMFKVQLQEKGVAYEVRYEGVNADHVIGDELRISQILINFLSNAVKFTSEGEVTVTISQMTGKGNKADFMFRVHDTGIGMSTEFLDRIFKPFEQESVNTGKVYGGTGLGMAITDQLVKLMGGEIVVDSQQGVGSDFTVYLTLPVTSQPLVEKSSEEEEETGKKYSIAGYRILVAEDNEINTMIMKEMMEQAGAAAEFVTDGLQAVNAVKEHPAFYYDCVLMDIQMPVMDGRTACRRIREMNREDASSLLIYALSADAFTEDERKSARYGMNGHFAKPINFPLMENTIGRQIFRQKGKK